MAEYNLLAAASKVKAARSNFALIRGESGDRVFISPRPAKDNELKEEFGKYKLILKGICFREGEEFVFAIKGTPSAAFEGLIANTFKKNNAGKFSSIIVLRQLGANESEDAASEAVGGATNQAAPAAGTDGAIPPPPPPPPTAPPGAKDGAPPGAAETVDEEGEYRKTKADIAPKLAAKIKSNPPERDELLGKLGEALKMEKVGEYGNARAIFFQLMEAMSPPPAKAMTADQLSLGLKKIAPRLQRAATANPGRRAEVLALEGKLRAALNAGKLADAQAAYLSALSLVKRLAPPPDPAEEAAFTKSWEQATQVWRDCVDVVDGQIEKIRSAMQMCGDEEFAIIADSGLATLTGNHKTPVMAAVQNVSKASGEDRRTAAATAREAIASFRDHVRSDERVTVCDKECEAEFGVKVTIRDEITRGLDALDKVLDTATDV